MYLELYNNANSDDIRTELLDKILDEILNYYKESEENDPLKRFTAYGQDIKFIFEHIPEKFALLIANRALIRNVFSDIKKLFTDYIIFKGKYQEYSEFTK